MSNYNINQDEELVYTNTGQLVGCIKNNILQKTADSNIHMLYKPPGWAWDKDIIDNAIERGISKTIIHEKNQNVDYCARLEDFYTFGEPLNRRYGDQICLPLKFWEIQKRGKPATQQLAFNFEGIS